MDFLSWLYPNKAKEGAVEKTPGILVLGAELVCPCGTSHSYLNINTEHLNIADLPQANVTDSIAIDNILPFGSCKRFGSVGWPCKKIMDTAVKWENSEPQTMMVNGEEVITTESTLICCVSGREIYAVTSGQEKENQFAQYKMVCEEIEESYPGLLAILLDPHGSMYLQEGIYERAIQFLEDYLNESEGEILLSDIYTGKNPKDIFVVAALDRLLTDCDGSTFEQLLNGLEITGTQTGMDQKEGWDALKLNQQMIEMLRIDCKATAEKVNTSSFARWTEEHKKFVNILGNTVLQLAYDVMLWHCATASAKTTAARSEGGSKADVLAQNRANGRAFEQQEFAKFSSQNSKAVEQITVKTPSGVRTRVDAIGLDANGNVVINEYKSSLTAPLTDNQKIAFPEIFESGATVVGKGKGIFTGGYQIPPGTKVTIIRPE